MLRVILLFLLISGFNSAFANVEIYQSKVSYFVEKDKPVDIEKARALLQSGQFVTTQLKNLTFGVNSKPVWVHYQVINTAEQALRYRLTTAITWIDYLDLYFENSHRQAMVLHAGDRLTGAPYIVPGVGIAFNLEFTPGINDIFVHAKTSDPIIFPVSLDEPERASQENSEINLLYGIVYGFLLALIVSNLMFYRVLGDDIYLYYSLVVSCFLFINVGYTGQGIFWIWSDYPGFQNFSVISVMVIYSIAVLSFGSRFFNIKKHSIITYKVIRGYQAVGFVSLCIGLLLQSQTVCAYISFTYLAIAATLLLALSVMHVRRVEEGKYFLAAVSCGMVGLITTDLAVMGFIPFTGFTFHSAEAGIVLEASIFALALTRQIRKREVARIKSERLASFDPLTNLHNRRSFYETIAPIMNEIRHDGAPLCVIMIDVDKFKSINDNYGHAVGDETLKIISKRIRAQLRNTDIAVRWGGEEILLFLPDTSLEHGTLLAERIRSSVEENPLHINNTEILLTISLGVATYQHQESIDTLIAEADRALLKAKDTGRNKVVVHENNPQDCVPEQG